MKWNEIEEVVCRKFLNIDVGLDIYTKYKKCISFSLITMEQTDSFFKQIEKMKSLHDNHFEIVRDLESAFKKSDITNQWIQGHI